MLEAGGAAVVLAFKLHRTGLVQRLKQRGFDVRQLIATDRLIQLDAGEVKEKITRLERVDRGRFLEVAETAIKRALRENGHTRRVVVFGEVVTALWQDGKRQAAHQLEQFWSELQQTLAFDLLCAYPLQCFARRGHAPGLDAICAAHTRVAPAEEYLAAETEEQRLRVVARLQQKARALETEARLNEERMEMVQTIAGLGSWEMDLVDESISLSPQAQRMLGLAVSGRTSVAELLRGMYYSGDRDAFLAALKKARTGRKEFSAVFRIKVAEQVRIFAMDGKLHYNAGQPLLLGILNDVTAARNAVA